MDKTLLKIGPHKCILSVPWSKNNTITGSTYNTLKTEVLSSQTFLHVHHCTIMFTNLKKKTMTFDYVVLRSSQSHCEWEITLERASAVSVLPSDSRKHKTSSRQDLASRYKLSFGTEVLLSTRNSCISQPFWFSSLARVTILTVRNYEGFYCLGF